MKITVPSEVSTVLLAGIALDTNNFTNRTTGRTFYAAYLLTNNGATVKKAQEYLKDDIKSYLREQDAVRSSEVYKEVAIIVCDENKRYSRQTLAKIADKLLQFKTIEASIVIGLLEEGQIGVSARSIGNIKIGKLLETFDGGGTDTSAAAIIQSGSLLEAKNNIISLI